MRQTLILGAGPAGLAAGYYLARTGHSVALIEAAPEVGGYGRTFQHGPFRYDAGAHRFHDKDSEITHDVKELMGDELIQVHAPSQIFWNSRFLDFPLSPANVARRIGPLTLARAATDLVRARLFSRENTNPNFADNAYHRYGKTIADAFLIGYSEKLWGVKAEMLMPEVSGGRLKGLRARTMLYELLRGKKEKTEHLDGSFYYPRQGYGQITERLAQSIGRENIRTNCRITKLFHDGHNISSVELDGRERISAVRVVNTLAPTQLLELLDPAPPRSILELSRTLRFRDLILVALFLNRSRVSNNASIYFPSPETPITRLYEPKNRSLELAPPRQTCVVAEIPCFSNDGNWMMSDEDLSSLATSHLVQAKLFRADEVIGAKVHRLKNAYPVLEMGKDKTVSELRSYLERLTNLYTVGRAGKFEYTHVHDLLRQGKELARLLRVDTVPADAVPQLVT